MSVGITDHHALTDAHVIADTDFLGNDKPTSVRKATVVAHLEERAVVVVTCEADSNPTTDGDVVAENDVTAALNPGQ